MAAVLELKARLDNQLATAQEETKHIDLFAPIAEREECPMCLVPLPINEGEIIFNECCGKRICQGCFYNIFKTEIMKGITEHNWKMKTKEEFKCAYCRQSSTNIIKELKRLMKRNNTQAFIQMADKYKSGVEGVIQSNTKSLEMYICAAELGCADAYVSIGLYFIEGLVVEQDSSKASEFWEVGAKKGSVSAHKYLARFHWKVNGNAQLMIDHLKVAASAGDQASMDNLMVNYKQTSLVSKEDLTQTLRAFQASINELRNKDRDEACEFYADME